MRRTSSWLVWGILAAILWCAWGWGVYMPLSRRDQQWVEQRAQLQQERLEALQRLKAAPDMATRSDSLADAVGRAIGGFPRAAELEPFLGELASLARQEGIKRVETLPDLNSMMDISTAPVTGQSQEPRLDTLVVELKADGGFRSVGGWLDKIEERTDFQQWTSCRWNKGEEGGTVEFSGQAAFWVVVTAEQKP